jgi:hypothetical protein
MEEPVLCLISGLGIQYADLVRREKNNYMNYTNIISIIALKYYPNFVIKGRTQFILGLQTSSKSCRVA